MRCAHREAGAEARPSLADLHDACTASGTAQRCGSDGAGNSASGTFGQTPIKNSAWDLPYDENMTGRFAAVADIHGNIWALEAVLDHARRRGVDQFVNLGDVLYGPLQPQETFLRLQSEAALATVAGNEDRAIVEAFADELDRNRTLRFVVEDLGTEAVDWLKQLPVTAVLGGDVLLCHGSPGDDTVYLLEEVSSLHPVVRSDEEVRRLLNGANQPLVLCGHSHLPRLVRLAAGQLLVNPGSVGLPAYEDESPVPHRMETFSPHSSYAILECAPDGWEVELHRVPYDWEEAARCARSRGREDWARSLLTGRVGS
jgi:putative phosphoesterase